MEIGIVGFETLETGGKKGIGSTNKLISKVRVGGSELSIIDRRETTCKALFWIVPWLVNCGPE